MSAADIQAKAFTDNDVAREAIEALMWPNGPVCPHNGCMGKIGKVEGKSARPGLYYCGDCKKQFTVTVGTIFERSKVPLSKWWMAIHLMASSKKGVSAHQIHRMLGVAYQTAWFMEHRIREAMRDGSLSPMGGSRAVVEIDETAIGRTIDAPKKGRALGGRSGFRNTVLTLVERGGSARSFHIDAASVASMLPIINANVAREAAVMTDEWAAYREIGKATPRMTQFITAMRSMFVARARRLSRPTPSKATLNFQARHEGRLSALQREAPTPLPCRVRFPLQQSRQARRERHNACGQNRHGGQGQALAISTA
jgi:transposase-like protein